MFRYSLVRMKAGEEWKTAFRTRYGLFEYCVIPLGLTNAPLHEHLHIFVVAYLDDILIFSKTEIEHIKQVKKVLAKLATIPLMLEPEKCGFHKEELTFLGFVVGRNGIRRTQPRSRQSPLGRPHKQSKKCSPSWDWPTSTADSSKTI
jgi:hypothetical protein